jgi:hypothetical protein
MCVLFSMHSCTNLCLVFFCHWRLCLCSGSYHRRQVQIKQVPQRRLACLRTAAASLALGAHAGAWHQARVGAFCGFGYTLSFV